MIRKQIYIDEDLDVALARLAARTGEPEARHVRRALRVYLEAGAAAEAAVPYHVERDPLIAYIGAAGADVGPDDSAEQHDHYLYGTPKVSAAPKDAKPRLKRR